LYLGPITLPGAAKDGGILDGGLDKSTAFQNSFKALNYPAATPRIQAFARAPETNSGIGRGGDLGQSGQVGGDGYVIASLTSVPTTSYDTEANKENGATAGAAGAAINTNGNTVTYLTTGDIRGAII